MPPPTVLFSKTPIANAQVRNANKANPFRFQEQTFNMTNIIESFEYSTAEKRNNKTQS
jgi:hypothetical protein